MIAAPLLLTLFSLAPIFSLGAQGKKRLCPGLAPRPNIKLLPSPHLNSYDFPTCFAIWVFVSLSLHFYTVTIEVSPFTTIKKRGLFTRSSMPERKMSNLIITSFGRKLLVAILRSFTCGQTIRRRMCSHLRCLSLLPVAWQLATPPWRWAEGSGQLEGWGKFWANAQRKSWWIAWSSSCLPLLYQDRPKSRFSQIGYYTTCICCLYIHNKACPIT